MSGTAPLVIGVGNPWRGDDGAGIEVARRVGGIAFEGDGTGLVELWAGAEDAVVVDAAASGAAPGTVHRFDAAAGPLPARSLRSSTHHFGVADAIELARALDRLPPRCASTRSRARTSARAGRCRRRSRKRWTRSWPSWQHRRVGPNPRLRCRRSWLSGGRCTR